MCSDEEHLIGDVANAGADRPEPHAGEDVGIVALARMQHFPVVFHRIERTSGRENACTLEQNGKISNFSYHIRFPMHRML